MPTVEPASQAEIVAQRLAEIGMSVSAFASALGVAPAYVYAVLRGTKRLTSDATIQRASGILGISTDLLYLAIDRVPPDVLAMVQEHPILLDAVRKLAAKLDAQASSTGPTEPAPAIHAHVT